MMCTMDTCSKAIITNATKSSAIAEGLRDALC